MAKTGNIYPPHVDSPPEAILKSEASIVKETGLTPKEHHRKIELALETVTRAANEAQVDVVRRIEARAWDTRFEIEKLADQIPPIVEGGVALITSAVRTAKSEISAATTLQAQRIRDHQIREGEDLQANRDAAIQQIADSLRGASTALGEFATQLSAAFDARLALTRRLIRNVPRTGQAERVPARLLPGHEGEAEAPTPPPAAPPPAPGAAPAQAPMRLMSEAQTRINEHLGQSTTPLQQYMDSACQANLPDLITERQRSMEQAATEYAERVDSGPNRAQFLITALGLVNPARQGADEDDPQHRDAEAEQNEQERRAEMSAQQLAAYDVTQNGQKAVKWLDKQLPKWAESLRKAGRKIRNAMLNQARAAETGLATSAASMADSYPEILRRLGPTLASGRFLDSRAVVPELDSARDGARSLHDQHLQVINDQAVETLKGAQEGFEQQRKELLKMARDTADGAADASTRAMFDLELAADQFTGTLMQGNRSAMGRATAYASRTAADLLRRTRAIQGRAATPLDEAAAGFLNGCIADMASRYSRSVNTAEDDFEAAGGPFQTVRQSVRDDVVGRADRLHGALPEPAGFWDYAGAIGAGVILGGGVGAVIGAGAVAYQHDASEGDVMDALNRLPWPGGDVVAAVYDGRGQYRSGGRELNISRNYGDLRHDIEERCGNPEKDRALGLLSSDPGQRGQARVAIASDTPGFLGIGGSSRAQREGALASMSDAERAALPPTALGDLRDQLRRDLGHQEFQMSEAYLDRNAGRALALRLEEELQRARFEGDDALVRTNDRIEELARQELGGTFSNAFVPQSRVDALVGQMFLEHARLTTGREVTDQDEARRLFVEHASTKLVLVEGPVPDSYQVESRAIDPHARQAIEAQVMALGRPHDTERRDAAWVARAAYEVERAEREGSGEETQTRINAVEDPEWFRVQREYQQASPSDRAAMEQQFRQARTAHERRMTALAT
ncbi:MAG TPA: hypothetical protein VND93_22000, partial [Myxococcales bacterium]|nr:hypothetical protein [Myxococcales bacterium]